MVTYNRIPILISNINTLRTALKKTKNIYDFDIFAICVLPDHIHMIIKPQIVEEYPKIISAIKHSFSRSVGQVCPTYGVSAGYKNKREKGIWQRRYFEHTIKSEDEMEKHLDYIHYNPVKHGYVLAVKDWPYSSFNEFVDKEWYNLNWGNNKDIEKIKDMNYE